MKYVKKPVVIDAIKFTGVNEEKIKEMAEFIGYKPDVVDVNGLLHLSIITLEGNHLAKPGDFIIKGVAGEFYPCKPDIFKATYEVAE